MARPKPTDEILWLRINEKVDKSGGCWIWKNAVDINGYPVMGGGKSGVVVKVSRWIMSFLGHDIKNKMVLHRCDTPACVNPKHLYIGDQFDNMKDMWDRGRSWIQKYPEKVKPHYTKLAKANAKNRDYRGEKHPQAKLNESDVLDIIKNSKETQRDLAKKYSVSFHLISKIKTGECWNTERCRQARKKYPHKKNRRPDYL